MTTSTTVSQQIEQTTTYKISDDPLTIVLILVLCLAFHRRK
jgi:hypothetical protein